MGVVPHIAATPILVNKKWSANVGSRRSLRAAPLLSPYKQHRTTGFSGAPASIFFDASFVLTNLHPRIGLIGLRVQIAGALCTLSGTARTVQRLDYVILSDFIDSSVTIV